jgi:serine/threonine protein phosphatase PrpC
MRLPKPGRARCEDVAGGLDRTWWLMDGATGVIAPEGVCDSGWFAETIQASFLSQLAEEPAAPLDQLISQATQAASEQFARLAPPSMRNHSPWWPSSTLVLIRLLDADGPMTELDIRVVGDSDLAIIGRGGEVRTVRDDRHTQYCSGLYQEVMAALREGVGYESDRFRNALAAAVTIERQNRNRPETYWVLAPEPFAPMNALRTTLSLNSGDRIVLCSDGAARGHAVFGLQGADDAFRAFATGDLGSLLQRVRAAEDKDHEGSAAPRGTRHDDATVLRLSF